MRDEAFVHYRRLRRDRDGHVVLDGRGWPIPEARGGATVRIVRMLDLPYGDGEAKLARALAGSAAAVIFGATVAVCSVDDAYVKATGRWLARAYATWPNRATLFAAPPTTADLDRLVAAATARTSLTRYGKLYRWLGRSAGIRRARRLDPDAQLHLFSRGDAPALASPFEASRAWARLGHAG